MARTSNRPAPTLKYKELEKVTLPDLQFEREVEYFIRPSGLIVRGIAREEQAPGEVRGGAARKIKTPPWKCRVMDLQTGELCSALFPSLMASGFQEAYPEGEYVGRDFKIVVHDKAKGKDYFTVDIVEIDVETGGESEVGGE